MEAFIQSSRYWLPSVLAFLVLLFPDVSGAGYYTKRLLELLDRTPWCVTARDNLATAYAPDIMVSQSKLDTVKVPIALKIPQAQCINSQADSEGPSVPECLIPEFEVSFSQEDGQWHTIPANNDMAYIDFEKSHRFTVNLPRLSCHHDTQIVVFRVHVKGPETTEFKFLVAVVPDGQKPELAVYDFDGTVALNVQGQDPLLPHDPVHNTIKGNLKEGRLIAYNTSRPVEQTESIREWLITNGFPPGLIFAAPMSLERTNQEARKEFKRSILEQLSTVSTLKAMWGDSAIADALAGMEAQVAKIHLIHHHNSFDSNPERIQRRIPDNYRRHEPKQLIQKFGRQYITSSHHIYERTFVRVAESDPPSPVCVGLRCLPPPPPNGTQSFSDLHPAHQHMIIRALQNQHSKMDVISQ